ncbi:MAG: RluA family pseudouridine synthase [Sphaerochaetaceae bacterium]|nr:RluA family pseudouridine synthase [Sphaerochaetaceae bacterium]
MNPILPVSQAQALCRELYSKLQENKYMSTCGPRMVGILLCTDGTVFKAVSGKFDENLQKEGFVDPAYNIREYTETLEKYDAVIKSDKRKLLNKETSRECWEILKGLYTFHCADGKTRTLTEIFPNAPSGTGDCCAPKLLNQCYRSGKKPLSMAEFYFDADSDDSEIHYYGPCDSRCRPILKHIIGLDIVYCDEDIVVVNKPSGLLAIEGKGEDKQDCVASRVRDFYHNCIQQPCIHRLDQATSGLMVLGLTDFAHNTLSRDFEERRVSKSYEAVVVGKIKDREGVIDLPIRADIEHRPLQIVDHIYGKKAVTHWERIKTDNRNGVNCTRLKLTPETGRTHQLRVHCAEGLMCPIAGDALYGKDDKTESKRLLLQARELSFIHPVTKKEMSFVLERDF